MTAEEGGDPIAQTFSFDTVRRSSTAYVVTADMVSDAQLFTFVGREIALVHDARLADCQPELLHAIDEALDPKGKLGLEAGESLKSLANVTRIVDFLSGIALAKDGVVVALGGGTICDTASVAAMLFRRGVELVMMPTTLLAQIDAAIGGKNGVNLNNVKNIAGQFYHPSQVICDTRFLDSLPAREFVGGLAEGIKVLAVSDAAPFHAIIGDGDPAAIRRDGARLNRLVGDALRLKLSLLAEDPFELSSRRLLNYGHAFAHAFEEASAFRLTHGEAVLLGMTIENAIAMELGLAGPDVERLQRIIGGLITPECRQHWIGSTALPALAGELRQARRGQLNLVCLRAIGEAVILDDLPDAILHSAWERSFAAIIAEAAVA